MAKYIIGMEKYIKPKACPRCIGGDLFIENDHGELYEHCLQCGYEKEVGYQRKLPDNRPVTSNGNGVLEDIIKAQRTSS